MSIEKHTLTMPKNDGTKDLIEGHPLGVSKIIKGDLRTINYEVDGVVHSVHKTDGTLLYDKLEKHNRSWFVLAFESGDRIVD